MTRAVLMVVIGVVGATLDASAHGRSVSHSQWRLTETGAHVELRMSERDLAVRGVADPGAYAISRLGATARREPCRAAGARLLSAAVGWRRLAWDVDCGGPPDRLENRLFLDGPGARLHFARVWRPGMPPVEVLFGPGDVTRALPSSDAAAAESPIHAIGGFVLLGVEHIVTGWDHLAFLAGLLVLAGKLGDVVVLASGFTVAHSVTLALSVLGLARPDRAAVEALIGFSILLVAAENAWLVAGRGRAIPAAVVGLVAMLALARAAGVGAVSETTLAGLALFTLAHFGLLAVGRHPARLRAAVAFGFGLVHGFGFAGILQEAALPQQAVVPALLGFNVGVELGQLAAVAVAWPLLVLVRDRGGRGRIVVEGTSAALAGLGALWFVGRALG